MYENIKCPYCGFTDEDSLFPDLFYEDINNSEEVNKQYRLLLELQALGYNIVTCGHCGEVIITKGRV